MRTYLCALMLALSGCDCGVQTLGRTACEINPMAAGCYDAGHPTPDASYFSSCKTGTVTGVICAPDLMTPVSGATVTVTTTCDGKSYTQTATTNASGDFTVTVEEGTGTLTASSGSFTQSFPITVNAGQTTSANMDQQFCFKPTVTNLAVISGSGDQIETLLTQVGFTPTVIDGSETGFDSATGGLQFLMDPTQLAQYNVLFIDCAAGRTKVDGGYAVFNFGAQAATIAANLQEFVQNGGSLYASDWAFIFIYLAYGSQFQWSTALGTTNTGSISFPFDPYNMEGEPSQNVTANVVDTGLAAYLGKPTVNITFPSNMTHWGLIEAVNSPATELITASVSACSNSTCAPDAGLPATTLPLAGLYRVTSGPGGAVAYTSFHNINQVDPTDVENILKYLIFKL